MKTSTARLPKYRKYAELEFTLQGKAFKLAVYQSSDLMKNVIYKNYLFLPFKDLSSGKETYGGGRYIDLELPVKDNVITLDFNKAYNPYCAYSTKYSCPLVPSENMLN